METKLNNSILENSFSEYEKIQTLHLEILKSNCIPDLEAMTIEREKLFLILKNSLQNMMENAGLNHGNDSVDFLSRYEKRLNLIIELDDAITKEIKNYRDRLKTDLNRIKQGKTAMKGYKNSSGNNSNPRVLSMNR